MCPVLGCVTIPVTYVVPGAARRGVNGIKLAFGYGSRIERICYKFYVNSDFEAFSNYVFKSAGSLILGVSTRRNENVFLCFGITVQRGFTLCFVIKNKDGRIVNAV